MSDDEEEQRREQEHFDRVMSARALKLEAEQKIPSSFEETVRRVVHGAPIRGWDHSMREAQERMREAEERRRSTPARLTDEELARELRKLREG